MRRRVADKWKSQIFSEISSTLNFRGYLTELSENQHHWDDLTSTWWTSSKKPRWYCRTCLMPWDVKRPTVDLFRIEHLFRVGWKRYDIGETCGLRTLIGYSQIRQSFHHSHTTFYPLDAYSKLDWILESVADPNIHQLKSFNGANIRYVFCFTFS